MPLASVLSELKGLLENAVNILTERPQQASTDFFDFSKLQDPVAMKAALAGSVFEWLRERDDDDSPVEYKFSPISHCTSGDKVKICSVPGQPGQFLTMTELNAKVARLAPGVLTFGDKAGAGAAALAVAGLPASLSIPTDATPLSELVVTVADQSKNIKIDEALTQVGAAMVPWAPGALAADALSRTAHDVLSGDAISVDAHKRSR